MRLFEDEAKDIFRENGIKVPHGISADSVERIEDFRQLLGSPIILKPLGIKGRGKSGLIATAQARKDIEGFIEDVLGSVVNGEKITEILAEEKIGIKKELYVAVTIDYSVGRPVLILSDEGGVDIEELAKHSPDKVKKLQTDITQGLDEACLKDIIQEMRVENKEGFLNVVQNVYKVFRDCDAEMVEINPLAVSDSGDFIAIDGVINVNDDALFRHSEFEKRARKELKSEFEKKMSEMGWSYIDLDGNIGVICSGAGLSMATLDLVHLFGGKTANFLDMAQVDGDGIYKAFEILTQKENLKAILINLFAGLNRCDSMAQGAKEFVTRNSIKVPVIARMVGNREEEGAKILHEAGIQNFSDLEKAVEVAVKAVVGIND